MMFALAAICILLAVFYSYSTWNNDFWKKRKVPHDKPSFFLGNLKDVMLGVKHMGVVYADLYNKYKDAAYVGYFKMRDPAILIRDPELIKNILIKDFSSFADNDFKADKHVDPIIVENIFMQTGEEWKKNRSAWSNGLSMAKIKATHEIMSKKCDQMVDYLKHHAESRSSDPFEARELSSSFFLDVVVHSIFKLKVNSFEGKTNRYKKIVNSFFQPSFWDGMKFMSMTFFPGLAKFFRFAFVPKDIQQELMTIANEIVENRQKTQFEKNNAFDSILCNDNKYEKVSKYAVAGLVFNFLIDATETSAGLCGFVLYALAANPEVQTILREELTEAPKDENGKISFEIINKLPYLDGIICETLRLYPPALNMARLSTKRYTLPPAYPGGPEVTIEPGTPTTIPVYGLHMDPEYYPEPESFKPERFAEGARSSIPKGAYLPFGEGPRICIGNRFGINQVKIMACGIVSNFEIRLAPKMVNKSIEIDPNILIYRNKGGIWITLHNLPK